MATNPTLQSPLGEEDFQGLKEALATNTQLIDAINKAKAAGVDVGDRLKEANAQRSKIQSLMNTYFPGRY